MTRRDPVDRLRDANPVPLDEAPAPRSPKARALYERIVAAPTSPDPRTRPSRRRLWILVPAVVLALGAATYGLFRAVDQPSVLACYRQASLGADRAVLPATGGDPVAACRALWKPGGEFNPQGNASAPPLTACVLTSGGLGVFPSRTGTDTCAALGLRHPEKNNGEGTDAQAIQGFQESVATRFLTSCLDRQAATSFALRELQRWGLRGWRVVVGASFTAARPCASASLDAPHRTLTLIPVPISASP
jgi:hypothetical protein